MIKEPKNLQPKDTKIERLEEVIQNLLQQLPAGIRLIIHNSINLSQLFNNDEAEEKVNQFIEKTKEVIYYVEHGTGTIQENDQNKS